MTITKKISFFLILFALFSFSNLQAQRSTEDNLNWLTDYTKAKKVAKKENKPILMNFTGSDWCRWCWKLSDEVFSKKEFENWAKKNIVLLKVDFPRQDNQTDAEKLFNRNLMKIYGVKGFPRIIMIDAKEKLLGKTGYQDGGPVKYIKSLEKMYK